MKSKPESIVSFLKVNGSGDSVSSNRILPDPPYKRDTRVRGWRFELDYERIQQSDTWALSPPSLRPWLLMLWYTSWQQYPAGSLPDDDAIIAAKIGMNPKVFASNREILMRGWTLHSDQRFYHKIISEQVDRYIFARERERTRKIGYREKQRLIENVPRDTHGTPTGHQRTSTGLSRTSVGVPWESGHQNQNQNQNQRKKEEGDARGSNEQQLKAKPKTGGSRFAPPTLSEIQIFGTDEGLTDYSEDFRDYYEANGWRVGKNPMKSWKAAYRGWARRQNQYSGAHNGPHRKTSLTEQARKVADEYFGVECQSDGRASTSYDDRNVRRSVFREGGDESRSGDVGVIVDADFLRET